MCQIDLGSIYGAFKDYPSFRPIIELEFERWKTTDESYASLSILSRILLCPFYLVPTRDYALLCASILLSIHCVLDVSRQKILLERQLKKAKGTFTIQDWVTCIQSFGIPPETISTYVKQEVKHIRAGRKTVVEVFRVVFRSLAICGLSLLKCKNEISSLWPR
jgi:hypothetical protein